MRGQKGITLVALVITIIILVILAGISIASLSGNGLFGKAQEAVNVDKEGRNQENEAMAGYENELDNWLPDETTTE